MLEPVGVTLDELYRSFAGKQFIVFHRSRDIPFQALDLICFNGIPKLFNQSASPVPKFAGIRLRQTEPVIRRETVLFNAIAFQMCEADDKLGRYRAFFGSPKSLGSIGGS